MNDGPAIVGALFVLIVIGIAAGVIALLHEPGACYVGKAAWFSGNPC